MIEQVRVSVRLYGGEAHGNLVTCDEGCLRLAMPVWMDDGSIGQEVYDIEPGEYRNSPFVGVLTEA